MFSFSEVHTTYVTGLQYASCFSNISHSPLRSRSTCHGGENKRGIDQQLMMKYDPVICGLSAGEDVGEKESSDM